MLCSFQLLGWLLSVVAFGAFLFFFLCFFSYCLFQRLFWTKQKRKIFLQNNWQLSSPRCEATAAGMKAVTCVSGWIVPLKSANYRCQCCTAVKGSQYLLNKPVLCFFTYESVVLIQLEIWEHWWADVQFGVTRGYEAEQEKKGERKKWKETEKICSSTTWTKSKNPNKQIFITEHWHRAEKSVWMCFKSDQEHVGTPS